MKKLIFALLSLFAFTYAMAQGNNFGLGNEEEANLESLSSRLLNLEERSKFFQVYINYRGGYTESLDYGNKSGKIQSAHIRPEFLGELGKFGYRLRLNLTNDYKVNVYEGTNEVIDMFRLFYNPNEKWQVSFGKSPLNYGTFEFDWNPVHVLEYYEFQANQPGMNTMSASASYTAKNHTFTAEVANASTNTFEEDNHDASKRFAASKHPMQYSLSWRGNMLDGRIKTIWSYTLRNEASGCYTNMLMLGTSLAVGKCELQFDYNCAFGKIDYLGFATADAKSAGLINRDDIVTDTRYQQWVVDFGYRPTKRWNLFAKAGICTSSSADMEQLSNYRHTYEYSAVAQYYLDTTQDIRLSLGYFGKTVDYKSSLDIPDFSTNRIELSLVTRLKIL